MKTVTDWMMKTTVHNDNVTGVDDDDVESSAVGGSGSSANVGA